MCVMHLIDMVSALTGRKNDFHLSRNGDIILIWLLN
jgi:hypothetical protein